MKNIILIKIYNKIIDIAKSPYTIEMKTAFDYLTLTTSLISVTVYKATLLLRTFFYF